MSYRAVPRMLTGLAAAVAALGLVPPAAAAAPPPVDLRLVLPGVTVVPGDPGRSVGVVLALASSGGRQRPTVVRDLKIQVDSTGVADLVTVVRDPESISGGGPECSTVGTVLTCVYREPTVLSADDWDFQVLDLVVRPTPAARVGQSGELRVTASAPGLAPARAESPVRIGEGVDLAAAGPDRVAAAPGARAALRPRVRNAGELAADGAALLLFTPPALRPAARFGNCRYSEVVICTFTGELAPGRTYRTAEAFALPIPGDAAAPGGALGVGIWLTPTDLADMVNGATGDELGRPGTGGDLRLVEESARAARAAGTPQTDVDPENNLFPVEIAITGDRPADLAAVGATLTGAPGTRVPARIGVRNLGPATVDPELTGMETLHVVVGVPEGVSVVRADDRCLYLPVLDPHYYCMPEEPLHPGQAALFDFTFQVGADARQGAGTVTVEGAGRADRVASNDTAKILVDPGSSGGSGAGLPVTGAPGAVLAGSGVLLMLAGTAGAVLARRRRLRFIA